MKQVIWKNKKWVGYVLYCILLTFALLYYRFPADAFKDYIQATAQRINPDLLIRFESLSPYYPFGLKCTEAELALRGNPEKTIFLTETLYFRPKVLTLLKRDPVYCFETLAYGGNIKGRVHLIKEGLETSYETSVALNDISIDNNSDIPVIIGKHVKGVLNGTLTYNGKNKSLIDGTGEAILSLADGRIKISLPLLSLKAIDFKEVLLKMAFKNQRLKLSHAELKGENMMGMASGTIDMKKELPLSRLDLRVTIEPYADLIKNLPNGQDTMRSLKQHLKDGKFSFHIQGTIKDPKFRLI
ncbi:type II secretion system protein GspN [Thermodesulfobacteriota bacterium]